MLDSSLNTVSPLHSSFVGLTLGQSPLCRHKKCFWTWLSKQNIPHQAAFWSEQKVLIVSWRPIMFDTWWWRFWFQWNHSTPPFRKDWCRCVKTVFGGFLHLNLGFSGHSCFYQRDPIGLVAGGGKLLLTVKVVPTKESPASTTQMLMSSISFSSYD